MQSYWNKGKVFFSLEKSSTHRALVGNTNMGKTLDNNDRNQVVTSSGKSPRLRRQQARLDYQTLFGKMSSHSSPQSLSSGRIKTGPGRRRKSSLGVTRKTNDFCFRRAPFLPQLTQDKKEFKDSCFKNKLLPCLLMFAEVAEVPDTVESTLMQIKKAFILSRTS